MNEITLKVSLSKTIFIIFVVKGIFGLAVKMWHMGLTLKTFYKVFIILDKYFLISGALTKTW